MRQTYDPNSAIRLTALSLNFTQIQFRFDVIVINARLEFLRKIHIETNSEHTPISDALYVDQYEALLFASSALSL